MAMEFRARLSRMAHRIEAEYHAHNLGVEFRRHLKRMEEILDYLENKKMLREYNAKKLGTSKSQQVFDQRKATQQVIIDYQNAEADANLTDQKEAFEARNKKANIKQDTPPEYQDKPDEVKRDAAEEPEPQVSVEPPRKEQPVARRKFTEADGL